MSFGEKLMEINKIIKRQREIFRDDLNRQCDIVGRTMVDKEEVRATSVIKALIEELEGDKDAKGN